jgi:hypothetical protein
MQAPNRHLSLEDYRKKLDRAGTPTVINRSWLFTPAEREQREQSSPPKWSWIFEGDTYSAEEDQDRNADDAAATRDRDQVGERDHICLSCSQFDTSQATVSFDIDSFLGYATSLAFAC